MGARSGLKIELWESSEMVFIATRLTEITLGGNVSGEVPGSALELSYE